jgi:peptidoglycan/LPS O-acetylase OafA/YrhL
MAESAGHAGHVGARADGDLLEEIEAAMAPPRSHARFPLFDSLRGFAAISILVLHVAIFMVFAQGVSYTWWVRLVAHLDIGVAFFFLLSAFLLYRPFVAARVGAGRRPELAGYAKRRFLRIAPAYWAVLTISAIVPGMYGALSGNWWAYYGLLQNYPVYTPEGACVLDANRCAIPTAWSLSIEVFFYALLPFYALLMAWIGRWWGRRWLIPELGVAAALGIVSFLVQRQAPSTDLEMVAFYSPIGRGWWFGLGLALAAFSVWVAQRPRLPAAVRWIEDHPWVPVIGAGVLYAWLSFFVLFPGPGANYPTGDISEYLIQYAVFGVIALLILLPATFGGDGPGRYRAFLRHPIPTWLGLISYGIFLWQYPVLIALIDLGAADWWPALGFPTLAVTTFVATVICATISFYALERPLMRWGRRRRAGPA